MIKVACYCCYFFFHYCLLIPEEELLQGKEKKKGTIRTPLRSLVRLLFKGENSRGNGASFPQPAREWPSPVNMGVFDLHLRHSFFFFFFLIRLLLTGTEVSITAVKSVSTRRDAVNMLCLFCNWVEWGMSLVSSLWLLGGWLGDRCVLAWRQLVGESRTTLNTFFFYTAL